MPIHDDNHWLLMVVDLVAKTISILDSMEQLSRTQKYVEHWQKFTSCRNSNAWDLLPPVRKTETVSQQQTDGDSCGVFLMMNAEYVLSSSGRTKVEMGSQNHVPQYRKYVLARILEAAKPYQTNASCPMQTCHKPCGNNILWIECTYCFRWFHQACIDIFNVNENYQCLLCMI